MTEQLPHRAPIRVRPFARRYAALMLVIVALTTAAAYLVTRLETSTYRAQAKVLLQVLSRPGDAARTPDMGTEKAVVTSNVVLQHVAANLRTPVPTVSSHTSVTVPVDANLLLISYSSSDRNAATTGANAVAAAYVAYRNAQNPLAAVQAPTTATIPGLQASIVSPATTPTHAASPDTVVNVIAGVAVGALLAVMIAFLVDRLGSRILSARRWEEITGVPVLMEIGRARESVTDHEPLPGIDYLRALVERPLRATGGLVLLTSVHDLPARAEVAGDLVEAFLTSGRSATLVDLTRTDAPGSRAVQSLPDLLAISDDSEEVIVVDAPPLASSAMALDVARLADVVLLVDSTLTARRPDAIGAVAQLDAAGGALIGAVIAGVRRPRDRRLAEASLAATIEPARPTLAVVPIDWAGRSLPAPRRRSRAGRNAPSRPGHTDVSAT